MDSSEPVTSASDKLKSTLTPGACSSGTGQTCGDSATCENSTPASCPTPSCGAAGSPVNPSAPRASERVRATSAIYGLHGADSLPSVARVGCSVRTCPACSRPTGGALSAQSLATWPRSGMFASGRLLELETSAPRIVGNVCGSSQIYPTPTRTEYGSSLNGVLRHGGTTPSGSVQKPRPGAGRPSLSTMARTGMWPTPTVGDSRSSGSRNTAESSAHQGVSLTDAVRGDGGTGRTWPTPKASPSGPDFARMGREESGGDDPATSVARDVGADAASRGAAIRPTTQLNPDWVEWLQGFPVGWTALPVSETPLSRWLSSSSPGKSGGNS